MWKISELFRLLCLLTGILLTVRLYQFRKHPDRFVMEPLVLLLYGVSCAAFLVWAVLAPLLLSTPLLWIPAGAVLVFCSGILLLALYTAVFPYFLRRYAPDGTEAILLVLGAPVWDSQPTSLLVSRALGAARWTQQHSDIRVVLSGGKRDARSEASLLAAIMEENHCSASGVYLEENSLTTDENFLLSKPILLELGWQPDQPLAVATNNFHFFRLRYYARRCGYEKLRFLIVPTPRKTAMVWYFREAIVLIRYWILKK